MINEFRGEYDFLSNFYETPVTYEGITYRNNEAAFQAAKLTDKEARREFSTLDASSAKKLGRRVSLRADWEEVKNQVMHEICLAKFSQNEQLKTKLLATGNEYLEEGNTWGDKIWGTVNGSGENRLGKILMNVRDTLRANIFDAKEVKDKCVQWIQEFFKENGPDCNAVIGISGGTDSTVVAALCVEALGKDRCVGVKMPNGVQPDISDVDKLIDYLGITSYLVDIGPTVSAILTGIDKTDVEISEQTRINLPPRIRMATLYAVSQSVNGRVANTCNLSEDWVGYSTRYGDSVGDFSPLSNLIKTEVKAIGHELGLPADLVEKIPADGLCGKTDEENLGFTYDILDKYIREGVCEDKTAKERIDELHRKNLFKLALMPSFKP